MLPKYRFRKLIGIFGWRGNRLRGIARVDVHRADIEREMRLRLLEEEAHHTGYSYQLGQELKLEPHPFAPFTNA